MAAAIPIGWVVALSILLSLVTAIGVNLQKLSMNNEELRPEHLRRSPVAQPYWLLGTTLVILKGVGDFFFVGMAPQTILAPLGALGPGWNVILAPIFHSNEKVTPRVLGATAIIYTGTIITVLNAVNESMQNDLSSIVELIKNRGFIIYISLVLLGIGALFVDGQKRGYKILHYCGLGGAFGGITLLFAKSSSEILQHASHTSDFSDWTSSPLPYLFLFGMVICVITQIHYLNGGLANFEALVVVPVYSTMWMVFDILGGMIFFQEYYVMTRKDIIMYILGNCISLAGVTILVMQQKRESAETAVHKELANGSSLDMEEGSEPGMELSQVDDTFMQEPDAPSSEGLRHRTLSEESGNPDISPEGVLT